MSTSAAHAAPSRATSEAVVQVREVFCVHRTAQGDAAALQGIDLELRRGEILCVLGPSGAGKTTLLRVLAGLQPPSVGSVRLLDRDIGRLRARERAALRHRHLGFVGQSSNTVLASDMSVEQVARLPLALRGVGRRQRTARAHQLLDAVGLLERARARPDELSGGERQRVALCCALAHSPALLLADEPTGELDRTSADATYELISSLVRAAGGSAIIASHDPGASAQADRTVTLRDGRVVEEHGGGAGTLVVGRGGWVRLPASLRAAASLGDRLEPRVVDGGLLLAAVPPRSASGSTHRQASPVATGSPERERACGEPVHVELAAVRRSFRQGVARRLVLEDITHTFAAGRVTVLTGRSGSGKTTLLRLIAGLDRPDGGELTLDGQGLSRHTREDLAELRRREIGFMAQDPAPVGFLSAHENIVVALRMRGWDPAAAARRATSVLDLVALSERGGQRASRLSAGEVQRLGLARALAGARGLLLVDEPTSRLDEANAHRVAGLLSEASRAEHHTVICASHDPAVIAQADELLTLG